jgi:hypothetical protein
LINTYFKEFRLDKIATLVEQPEKTELEYRVIVVNKAGEGSPSNTVMVVL